MKYSLINSGFDTSWLSDFFNVNESALNNRVCSFSSGTDIEELDDGYVIRVAVPGMSKEDLKISLDDGLVKVSGEKKISKGMTSKVNREFSTKIKIDAKNSKATVNNGILEIQLKQEKGARNTIEIT